MGIILVVGIAIRFFTFTNSTDATLEQKVRDVLWSTYSGIHLGPEINEIREKGAYGNVPALLEKTSPAAIIIEQISRSEPLLSLSTSQDVIVRVYYRFPNETTTQIEYMRFNHSKIAGWVYQYDTSVIAYYLNFF